MKHICTKFVAMLLVIAMIAGVLPFAFAANVGPFTDVKDTDWFASNVQYVYDNGLMNGTTTTTFEPESNLTRAQTAMVLWRIAGQPAPTAKAPSPIWWMHGTVMPSHGPQSRRSSTAAATARSTPQASSPAKSSSP